MPFLKLETGKEYDLAIVSEDFKSRERHWIAGRAFECEGMGCQYCTANFAKRKEYILDVKHEGTDYAWSFPELVYQAIKEGCPTLKGSEITVSKTGKGVDTRYQVVAQGAKVTPGLPGETVPISTKMLTLLVRTLHDMADDLDKLLGEPEELPF